MPIVISIIKAIIGYFILMLVGVNLIGIVVRGFIRSNSNNQVFNENITAPQSIFTTVIGLLITTAYLYALYYFFNIGVLLSAILLMVARIPDLVFEIRIGQKINAINMPKKPIYVVFNIVGWLAIPLLWYSLYVIEMNKP